MATVKSYPASAPRYPKYVWVTFAYALALADMAVMSLIGVGGFDFAGISYTTPGLPVMTVTLAGMAIFALPFVLRLQLSVLARFLSALFALMAPVMLTGYISYLMSESIIQLNWLALAGCVILIGFGGASFTILRGDRALRFSKK